MKVCVYVSHDILTVLYQEGKVCYQMWPLDNIKYMCTVYK